MGHLTKGSEQSKALAVGLGWFSVGLGLAELTAPGSVARLIGIRDDDYAVSLLRAYGARKIANGIAILSEPERPAWLWSRVAGDAVDLLSLLQAQRSNSTKTAAATAAVLGVTAIDLYCAQRLAGKDDGLPGRRTRGMLAEVQVTEAITVNRSIEDVYNFWRNFENFPLFMKHIESVEVSGRQSRWRAIGPAGLRVEWQAELLEERELERMSWRTVEPSDVLHHGSVHFARAPRSSGTEIQVHLHYAPPAGQLSRGIAWLLGSDPESQIREDLRRFKQLMETGEVVLSEGPGLWRSAQPAEKPESLKQVVGVRS